MKIKLWRVLLFTILSVGLSIGREGVVRASPYTFPATAKAIDVSGDKMVYMKMTNNDWDVYLYNLSTGEEKRITQATGLQGFPAISGEYIVWQSNRSDNPITVSDIYLYNLNTGQVERVNQNSGNNQDVEINGNYVVWTETEKTKHTLHLFDLTTRMERQITSDEAQAFGAQISGQKVVWMDARSGQFDVYMYDIATGQERKVSEVASRKADPKFVGDSVVWHDYRNGKKQIWMFDPTVGREWNVSAEGQDAMLLATDDNRIVYALNDDDNRVVLYDANKKMNYQLVGITDISSVFLQGDRIYWRKGNSIHKEDIGNVAVPNSKVVSQANGESLSDDQGWVQLTDQGGVVKSADNQFVLEVPPGSVQGSVRVKIEAVSNLSSERLVHNYQLISNIYRIKVENGAINGSSTIHFNEAHLAGSSLDRNKMVIQRLGQDPFNWTIVRNKFNGKGLLTGVQGPQFGDFVLTYSTKEFDDVIGHWAQEKIEALASQELVSGYKDRQFQPDQPITRAEFTKMIVTALDLPIENTEKAPFSDTQGHWAEPFVRTAVQKGIVFGEGIYFRPDNFITRQEMMAIIARVLDENVEVTNPVGNLKSMFQDADEIEEWSRPSIQKVVELGFIHGKDGRIAPMERTTRAEAATVLFQMIEQL